jgi:hypothetical protein
LKYKGAESSYRKNDLTEFDKEIEHILGPILNKIKSMKEDERDSIRKRTGKGPILTSAQQLIWDLKEQYNFGSELWAKGGWTPSVPKEESDQDIRALVEGTEIQIRKYVIQNLKEYHGEEWYQKGIPEGVKEYINKVLGQDIKISPWKDPLKCSDDEKITKMATPHLREIIINNKNWDKFKDTFWNDKEFVNISFKYFENIRNKYSHPERVLDMEPEERGLGYWFTRSIRKCIGLK